METLAGQIAGLKIKVQAETARMNDEINGIRARFAPGLALLEDNLATAMDSARAWAEANPEEFGAARSIDMTHAIIGYRTGQPQLKTLSGWTWDRVLEKLMVIGIPWIRLKKEVDKQGILNHRESLGDKYLREIGVRIVQEETFFVDPRLTDVEKRETIPSDAIKK
jgi:phage host-nuclease inhibitor protein Gam